MLGSFTTIARRTPKILGRNWWKTSFARYVNKEIAFISTIIVSIELLIFCYWKKKKCVAETCKNKFSNLKNNYYKNIRNDTVGPEMRRRCAFLDEVRIDKWTFQILWIRIDIFFIWIVYHKASTMESSAWKSGSHHITSPNQTASNGLQRVSTSSESCANEDKTWR